MQLSSDQPLEPTSQTSSPVFVTYADVMRTMAIFMVVWIHTASPYVYGQSLTPETAQSWSMGNVLMALMRPAVPLFLMLSGLLLLQPQKASEPLATFFQKRLARVLLPFGFWSVAFLGWRIWFRGEVISIPQAVQELLKGTVYPHLWFMYLILGLYLATPILRQYVKQATLANFLYGLTLWAIASIVMPLLKLLWGFEFQLVGFLPFTGYLGFYMAGYYLNQVSVAPWLRRCLPLVYIGGALFTAGITEALTRQAHGKIDDTFYNGLTLNIGIMAVCLFLWIKELSCHQSQGFATVKPIKQLMQILGTTSFSVYLIHPALIEVCQSGRLGFQLTALPLSPLIVIPVFTLLIWIAAIGLVQLIRWLPGGRLIVT
jgi:surface polysaccharide O-acyltransferase-like enzyme